MGKILMVVLFSDWTVERSYSNVKLPSLVICRKDKSDNKFEYGCWMIKSKQSCSTHPRSDIEKCSSVNEVN